MDRTRCEYEDLYPEVTSHQRFDKDVTYYDGLCMGANDLYEIQEWDVVWDLDIPEDEQRYYNAERVYLLRAHDNKYYWILERNTDHNFFE